MTTGPSDIRNIAIIAHVDHGKTTLVDAMLQQTGSFRAGAEVVDRAMDTMDQERERGITILAKHASVRRGDLKINIIDTPGHADFGGEVERGLAMVDGVLLLVDASEGPLPQTRFVLRKALEAHLKIMVVVNKVDRPDARTAEVVDEVFDLLIDLAGDDAPVDLPVIFASARAGASWTEAPDVSQIDFANPGADLGPLFDAIAEHVPSPTGDPTAPLQALVTNLDASPYLGRLALCRIYNGTINKGQWVGWIREDGVPLRVKVGEVHAAEAMNRIEVDSAGAGDIVAVSGIPEITIGDTLADAEEPVALPRITVDEPSLSMIIGINTSPLVGKDKAGKKLTARMVQNRLEQELVGNVAIKVVDIGRPDAWEVQGRGEMQLAVLVETMRREGFELTVGKPQVLTKEINGKLHEPYEHATIDVPDEHVGTVTQLLGTRKGRLLAMIPGTQGWTRVEYAVPARGLIGFRTSFLSETRGTGMLHTLFEDYEPWAGDIRTRSTGSLISDRGGVATGYSLQKLETRGTMFVEPGDEVYEGSIIGENLRLEDLNVNIVREKHLTNHRSATSDVLTTMAPPRLMSLDEALEYIRDDECVEVTPSKVRLRKVLLTQVDRSRARSRQHSLTESATARS